MNTQLVCIPQALVTSQHYHEYDSAEEAIWAKRIAILTKELNELRGETNNLDLNIQVMEENMKKIFSGSEMLLKSLREELSKLSNKDFVEDVDPVAKPIPELNREDRRERDSLFRKIASKTHPDRTNDPELVFVFGVAKKAHTENDVEFLRKILWGLNQGKKTFSKLKLQLDSLEQDRERVVTYLSNLKNSIIHSTYQLWISPNKKKLAEEIYAKELFLKIEHAKEQIRIIDPSRHQPPSPSATYWRTIC